MPAAPRKTHLPVIHEISVDLGPNSPLQGIIGVLPPGAVVVSQTVLVVTAFNVATGTIATGTAPGAADLVGGVDMKTPAHLQGPLGVVAGGPWPNGLTIYYTMTVTGGPATVGRVVYWFEYIPGPG